MFIDSKIILKRFLHEGLANCFSLFCSIRSETIRINWGAYPRYHAPETFAPFVLDGRHLYYVNAFENAASTMETSAVAAENIARLILSRFFGVGLLRSTTSSNMSHKEL